MLVTMDACEREGGVQEEIARGGDKGVGMHVHARSTVRMRASVRVKTTARATQGLLP